MFCVNGHWGIVCGDLWDKADTEVVCKQYSWAIMVCFHMYGVIFYRANYAISSGTGKSSYLSYMYEGSGLILLDEVECMGSELRLTNCWHNANISDRGHHNCH